MVNKKINKKIVLILLILLFSLALTACIPGDGSYSSSDPAGFFSGIWHGWIAPISLIIGIFDKNISVYELNNTGWWYGFGFYIAVISGFGGLRIFRKKRKKD